MEEEVTNIRERFENIQTIIHQTALSCNRNPDSIKLIVVTKAQPSETVRAALLAGARILGENYVQEGITKRLEFKDEFLNGILSKLITEKDFDDFACRLEANVKG